MDAFSYDSDSLPALQMQNHLLDLEAKRSSAGAGGGQPNWGTVRYMVSSIQYGGRITDDFDRLLMDTYAERYYHPGVLAKGYELHADPRAMAAGGGVGGAPPGGAAGAGAGASAGGGVGAGGAKQGSTSNSYAIPDAADIESFRAAIEELPGSEGPEVFGLHSNADLTFRTLQVRAGQPGQPGRPGQPVCLLCPQPMRLPLTLPPIASYSDDPAADSLISETAKLPCRSRTPSSSSWTRGPRAAAAAGGGRPRRRWTAPARTSWRRFLLSLTVR